MINIEKSLAEKVLFAIHIKDEPSVIDTYRKFLDHRELHKGKRNMEILEKVNVAYANYMKEKYGGEK